jgi:hypothetical protein
MVGIDSCPPHASLFSSSSDTLFESMYHSQAGPTISLPQTMP